MSSCNGRFWACVFLKFILWRERSEYIHIHHSFDVEVYLFFVSTCLWVKEANITNYLPFMLLDELCIAVD